MKPHFKSVLPLLLFGITGCSVLNEEFDCPLQGKAACISLREADRAVSQSQNNDSEVFYSTTPVKTLVVEPTATSLESFSDITYHWRGDFTAVLASKNTQSIPLRKTKSWVRTPETVIRIWIAPFEDTEGNYHEASVIHTVVQPSRWILKTTQQE